MGVISMAKDMQMEESPHMDCDLLHIDGNLMVSGTRGNSSDLLVGLNDEEGKNKESVKPPVKQDLVWEIKIFDAKLYGMDIQCSKAFSHVGKLNHHNKKYHHQYNHPPPDY